MAHILHNNLIPESSLTYDLNGLIDIFIQNNSLEKLFIVLPTGRLVRYNKRKIIQKYFSLHNKPLSKLNILTLHSLVKHCFELIYQNVNYKLISDSLKVYLFEEAAKRADFSFYQNNHISTAIIQKMSNIIMGLKSDGIYADAIRQELYSEHQTSEIFDKSRYEDIYKLYNNYQQLLGDKLIDQHDIIRLVNEYLQIVPLTYPYTDLTKREKISHHPLNNLFSKDSIITLSGFSQFRQPEIEFLSHFSSSLIPIIIYIDYSEANGPLFGNLLDTLHKLELAGFCNINLEEKFPTKFLHSKSTYLRKWLFNTEQNLENKTFINQIKIISTPDKTTEVFSIAKLIRWYNQIHKIPLHEICVLMRKPELYSNIFRDVFRITGIPANITDRFDLSQSPISVAIINVLDAITHNFSREKLNKALKSKYLTFNDKKGNTINPDNLYSVAIELKINNTYGLGLDFWEHRISNRLNYWENQSVTDYENENYDFYDIKNKIKRYQKAFNDIKILKEIFKDLPKKLKPDNFYQFITKDIINQLKIRENLINTFYSQRATFLESPIEANFTLDEIEKECRALTLIINLLDEMKTILKELYPDKIFSFADLVRQFKTILGNGKYQILEKYKYGVTVTSIEQSRGIPYKVLILCSANDGQFPIPYKTESFLGKELKESEEKHIEAERMLFYQFLTNNPSSLDSNEQKLYIFYHKYEAENELIRSPFINELLKILSVDESIYVFDIDKLKTLEKIPDEFQWINAITTPAEVIQNLEFIDLETNLEQIKFDYRFRDWYNELFSKGKDFIFVEFLGNKKASRLYEKLNNNERLYLKAKGENPISATELEIYAKCPYFYFINRILNVQTEEKPEIQLTRLEQGNILHNILYRFYKQIQSECIETSEKPKIIPNNESLPAIIPVELKQDELLHYRETILKIANDELQKFIFDNLFFEINYAELIGSEEYPGLVLIWLQNEIKRISKNWQFKPALFEFSFGRANRNNKTEKFEIVIDEKLKISGKIDRVEVNDNLTEFIIADYKISYSKYLPSDSAIQKGRSFQMPFYILAMKMIFKDYYNSDIQYSGGVYYPIKPGFDNIKKQPITEKIVLIPEYSSLCETHKPTKYCEAILNKSIKYAMDYLDKIVRGDFPVEPLNKNVCSNCTFSNICRINDRG